MESDVASRVAHTGEMGGATQREPVLGSSPFSGNIFSTHSELATGHSG